MALSGTESLATLAKVPDDIVSTGGSCVVGTLGEILAGPARAGEEILFADIDLAEITRGKFDFDVIGHDARPDVLKLIVDEEPKPPSRRISDRCGHSREQRGCPPQRG